MVALGYWIFWVTLPRASLVNVYVWSAGVAPGA
jgi:hypothetical protein